LKSAPKSKVSQEIWNLTTRWLNTTESTPVETVKEPQPRIDPEANLKQFLAQAQTWEQNKLTAPNIQMTRMTELGLAGSFTKEISKFEGLRLAGSWPKRKR
jgi:hypothetical protein